MTREKWLETVEKIRRQFGLETERQESLGDELPGERQVVEFQAGNLGKIKMEWVEKPRLKDVKTTYSNRIGSSTKIENVYDEQELVNYLNVFKWNESDQTWEKMGNEFINL
ncbi:MAG TPA: hypothetical protein P5267_02845 [Patescibacteria group bacterium]|nr:hypothetical protein [Patescibacteria group bacterium]